MHVYACGCCCCECPLQRVLYRGTKCLGRELQARGHQGLEQLHRGLSVAAEQAFVNYVVRTGSLLQSAVCATRPPMGPPGTVFLTSSYEVSARSIVQSTCLEANPSLGNTMPALYGRLETLARNGSASQSPYIERELQLQWAVRESCFVPQTVRSFRPERGSSV